MTQPLIILGASARAAAFSALRAGFEPHAIDQFADRDLADRCAAIRIRHYPHEFLEALRHAPDAPWIYTGGLENYPRLVDSLAKLRPLWGNASDVLRAVRDPQLLEQAAREAGLRMPLRKSSLTAADGERQWLIKPRRSSGGHRVRFSPHGSQPQLRGSYYQQHISGHPCGAVYLATGQRCCMLGISQQLVGSSGPFIYGGSIAGPDVQATPQLMLLGEILTQRFGLRGLFNVDFLRNDEGDWPLEVNPRYSASVEVLERATGVNFLARHAAAFQPETIAPSRLSLARRVTGKAIVYANSEGLVPPEFDDLVTQYNCDSQWPDIADLPQIGHEFQRSQPICTIFAEGDSVAEVQGELACRALIVQQVLRSTAPCNSPSGRP